MKQDEITMEHMCEDNRSSQSHNVESDNSCDEMDIILEMNKKAGERALEEFWKAYFSSSAHTAS